MKTNDILIFVACFALGIAACAFFDSNSKDKKFEKIKVEIDSLKSQERQIINLDSLKSLIEYDIIKKNDSAIQVLTGQLLILKSEYRKLKLTDNEIQNRLDSISMPVLPEF